MLPISRILAPVDFSDRCLRMMPYVRSLAQTYNAELILLHVVNPFYGIPPTGISGPAMIPISPTILQDKAKELDAFAVSELQGLPVRRFVYEGDTTAQIVEFARAERVGLLAMPTHGYGVLRRFLIDSVTAKVLHDVSCPVLTGVHLENHSPGREGIFKNILCAVDLGPQSQEALSWAAQLASDFGAKLGIVHAMSALNPGVTLLLSPEFELQMAKPVRAELQKLQVAAGAEKAPIYIEEGDAPKTVATVAKGIGADLLVIGRGTREDDTGRLRTNAYAIIRQSPCPVISI
ncbi:MAG: universal stress protein [Acidobacteria bacterium]|nr:universal stress protein [Acidobacteriota bacterium]